MECERNSWIRIVCRAKLHLDLIAELMASRATPLLLLINISTTISEIQTELGHTYAQEH